jgi:hypothetical protein
MTREDIIRLAREAHREVVTKDYKGHAGQLDPWTMRLLEHFAALIAAAEREACAKACEDVWNSRKGLETGTALECVVAIRARGNK